MSFIEENTQNRQRNLIPAIDNYTKLINNYKKGINTGTFYEEPIGEDFIYPDW